MVLTYRNNSSDHILNKLIDVRYSNRQLLFGFDNNISVDYNFNVDVQQISLQADVFARQMFTYRSLFDMKRFLGSYQDDWLRLLHEAYVYARARAIYYGISSIYLMELPSDSINFPGNVLMTNLLAKRAFQFHIQDQQPRGIYAKINYSTNVLELLEPIFETYPDVKDGISDIPNVPSYQNEKYQAILNGLQAGLLYLNTRRENSSKNLFYMAELNDQTISQMTSPMSNPMLNSHLSLDGNKFYFINPVSVSGPGKMRFNESLYLSRAIGLCSDQLTIESNDFYNVADRDYYSDFLTREEVYAITGIKSEIVPYSWDQILVYLGIDTYKLENNLQISKRKRPSNGNNNTTQTKIP